MKLLKQTIPILALLTILGYDAVSCEGKWWCDRDDTCEKKGTIVFEFGKRQFMDLCNPETPKQRKPYTIEYQDGISIKVNNIDLNKYEVTLNTEKRTYTYEVEGAIIDEGSNIVQNEGMNTLIDSQIKDLDKIIKSNKDLNKKIDLLIEYAESNFDISEFSKIKEELEKLFASNLTRAEARIHRDKYFPSFEKNKKQLETSLIQFKELCFDFKEDTKDSLTVAKLEILNASLSLAEKNVKSLDKISNLLDGLKGEKSCIKFTLPIIEDDLVIIKLTFKGKDNESIETHSASIKVRGKWKIDASAGALFNFVSYDYNYFINGSNKIERGQSRQKITPVYPVALMHFYRKGEGQTSWGFSGGFGLTEDVKASFYAGLSVLVGENQRWVVTGGLSLRSVSRLKSQYTNGQGLSSLSSLPEETDLVEDIHQLGAFVSLTYNLSRKD